MSTRALSTQQIESLALRAWILGTGSRGSPYHGLLNLRRLYKAGARVPVVDPALPEVVRESGDAGALRHLDGM
jgi:DUF917 family protein